MISTSTDYTMMIYTMHNFATGETVKKTQITRPKMAGFVCIASEPSLPDMNGRGERLFRDANNRTYYAKQNADGFHRQP